jgi:DNA-binding MarR family transcriptional regulator
VRISLTSKGKEACEIVEKLYQRQLGSIETVGELNEEQFGELNRSLGRLERFWSDMIRFQL